MFRERSFDGLVKFTPLGFSRLSDEILGLPTPLIAVRQNAVAFDPGVRIPGAGELRVLWCLKSRKLGADLFEPGVLRPVQGANVIPIDGDHKVWS